MNTYTVREPGCTYWWRGTGFRKAKAALREAHARGLRRARIFAPCWVIRRTDGSGPAVGTGRTRAAAWRQAVENYPAATREDWANYAVRWEEEVVQ